MSGHDAVETETSHKGVALLIALLALCLAFSEMGGNNAERESQAHNLEASNLWAFFQAKTIRRTSVQLAAEQVEAQVPGVTDPALRESLEKRIAAWKKTADRYDTEPETGEGRKELAARAKAAEDKRDYQKSKNEIFELSSAILQIAIVLCSAMIITGIAALAWIAGGLGVVPIGLMLMGLLAPTMLGFF